MTIPSTEMLQTITRPWLDMIIRQLGSNLSIVRTVTAAPTDDAVDEWGKPVPSTTTEVIVAERAFIYQLPEETRVNFASPGGAVTIPDWEAIFDISAPVGVPGFRIRYRGMELVPVGVAEDMGNQGIGWRVRLLSPHQRGATS